MKPGEVFNPYKMFVGIHIPGAMLKLKDLSPGAKICWGRLKQYAGENGKAWPSHETLGEEQGVSSRQVKRYLEELAEKKFIKIVHSQTTNYYYFLWHEILEESLRVNISSRTDMSPPVGQICHPQEDGYVLQRESVKRISKENHLKASELEKTPAPTPLKKSSSILEEVKEKPKPKDPNRIELMLAQELKARILENNPKAKTPKNLDSWAQEIEKMIRLDDRTPEEVRNMIEFSQKDPFWLQNILSARKLREKYDQLYLKSRGQSKPQTSGSDEPKAWPDIRQWLLEAEGPQEADQAPVYKTEAPEVKQAPAEAPEPAQVPATDEEALQARALIRAKLQQGEPLKEAAV